MTMDTALRLETPEGTEIEIHPAGLPVRSLAFLVDELLRWVIISCGFAFTAFLGVFGEGLALIVFFCTYWLYGVAFEVLNNGATPGKQMQGLRVVHDDGTPIRPPASLVRNLVLWVDLLPMFYAAAIVSMAVSSRSQRLGDLAAGTLVVYQSNGASSPAAAMQATAMEGAAAPVAPALPVVLSQVEQGVLVDYLERSPGLTRERAQELAMLLTPVLGAAPADASRAVRQVAVSLRGGDPL